MEGSPGPLHGAGEEGPPWIVLSEGPDSEFVGWETTSAVSAVRRYRLRPDLGPDLAELILEVTPCYPEGGGQVADSGRFEAGAFAAELVDVRRADLEAPIVHRVRVVRGALPVSEISLERKARLLLLSSQASPPSSKHSCQSTLLNLTASTAGFRFRMTVRPSFSTSMPPHIHIRG